MDEIEALLPGVCRFLEEDLCQEELSSPCRYSLKQLLDRVEVLRLGQSPPRPGVPLRPPKQGRKSRSLPINKRFSLPTNALTPLKPSLEDTYEEPSSLLQPGLELKEADEESSGTEFENDEEDDNIGQDIILPKKAPARRLSSSHFLDQPWTMVGPLSHRYKQQKWQRLAFCVLAGMRLTAFKSTHSDKPTLAIFLSGYTAIYAERDSGMAHVIKLTHPHQETHVIASDTEEQALSWAEQINLYSRAITPSDVTSFMEHSVVHDGQEDSGFSAPVSSGSEGGSGDGVVGNSAAAAHRRFSCPVVQGSPAHFISNPPCTSANAASGITTVTPAGLNSCRPMHSVDGLLQSRSSGLISSMRRKVESLNARRKSRKSLVLLPVHFTPAEDAILTGVASVRMVNAQAGASPGSWVERWCQLRPGILETFRLDGPNVEFSINLDGVSLGLSNDKKHRAALRLSSSDPAVDLLLFEVSDKIQMGSWIRGFIQALGIIPTVPYEAIVDWLPCPGAETNAEEPIYDEVASPNCLNRSGSGGDSSARGTPNSMVQSPSPSVGGQPNRLVPLPPLPIRSDTCLGYSAGGCSDPSNDYYYGSSRNSVQTVIEAARSVDGDLSTSACSTSSSTADRRQMEERRRRLAEVMSRCKDPKESVGAGGDSNDPLYFEYEQGQSVRGGRGHRRVNSDPIHDPLMGKVPAKMPALAAAQRPTHLQTRRGEEAMEVDATAPATVDLSDIKALGAPPPPPQTPLAATPMTQTSTSFSAASTPTSSSSGSASGGVTLRPRSLLRKTSVEMAQEEMDNLKDDIALLRRKKSDLRRRPGSDEELRIIEEEIRLKDERLRGLQCGGPSRRRFSFQSCSNQ